MSMVTSCTLLSSAGPPAKLPRGALQSGRPAAVALQRKPRPLSVCCANGNDGHKVPVHKVHPGELNIPLQYPILTRSNYAAWVVKMEVFMRAQDIWEAVEKDIDDDHKNQKALAAIFQGIPDEILPLLAEKKKANTAWNTLKTMYVGGDRVKKARAQTLMGRLESLRMMETESIDDFAVRLMALVNQIRSLDENMAECYIVKKFLRAVPSKYLQIVLTIEQSNDLNMTKLVDVIDDLKAYEERLRISNCDNDL